MSRSCFAYALLLIFAAVLALFPAVGHAAALEAPPWPVFSPPPALAAPDKALLDSLREREVEEKDVPALERLAQSGHGMAALLLARYHGDFDASEMGVRWRRETAKLGNWRSALELADLYFPLGGSLGRDNFTIPPDFASGYAWLAIGISGLKQAVRTAGKEDLRKELAEKQAALDALWTLTLPSEQNRMKKLLAAWPKTIPPLPDAREPAPRLRNNKLSSWDVAGLERKIKAGDTAAMVRLGTFLANAGDSHDAVAAYSLLLKAADMGSGPARYALAWCRILGTGVARDEAEGEAFFRERAAKGEVEAFMALARLEAMRGNQDAWHAWLQKAADKGDGDAMLLLANSLKEQDGGKKAAAAQVEKAARSGSFEAVMEMVGVAEQARDVTALSKWLTVLVLRGDPVTAYNSRMMLAYFADGEPETVRRGMAEGEKWHKQYPPKPARE